MKDHTKPRGKMTAYAFFVQTCREEHKRQHPNEQVVFSEFSKKCAARWKCIRFFRKKLIYISYFLFLKFVTIISITPVERTQFEEMAARDKLRWEEEMKHWTPVDGRKGKKQKRKKDPNAPKRPQTAFFLMCADRRDALRAEFPDLRIGEIAKKLGAEWAACQGEKRAQYEATAARQKEEYKVKLEAYKNGAAAAALAAKEESQKLQQRQQQQQMHVQQIQSQPLVQHQQQQQQPMIATQQQQLQPQQIQIVNQNGQPIQYQTANGQQVLVQQVQGGQQVQYITQQHHQQLIQQHQQYEDDDDDSEEDEEESD